MKERSIYTSLAPLYDRLMEDVDYEAWADYIDEIIQLHHPSAEKLLELACGTGSVALSLDELGYYKITATDLSDEMIRIARQKGEATQSEVQFQTMDFLNVDIDDQFDAAYSLFDSVNYLHSGKQVVEMLNQCQKILKPNGILIFDFSTPRNSLDAVDYLNNEQAESGNFRFFRTSRYDPKNKIHFNEFEIEQLDEHSREVIHRFKEIHQQRIYSLEEMLLILEQTPYHLEAKYHDFSFMEAHENSARVTIILKCQKQQ